ncbi:uncharacterized protein LOC132545397 [Ylistrum balloti]|uniref:uncharacterized protein LOC132545397 n=1 Tax=Ylistrum balloti TaxID=509963 RepID=UPI002905ADB0|nr:uncharacterized protein LOC132545397 [Ylistrum balloti]
MDYLKPSFVMLLLVHFSYLTEAQRRINCTEGTTRQTLVINNIRVACCIPDSLRGIARCVKDNVYVTDAPITVTTTKRQITTVVRTEITTNTITTTEPLVTTTPTTTTVAPTTTQAEDVTEGSGEETNVGNAEEGDEQDNPASTGLSIGIPLVVLAAVVMAVLLLRVRYKRKKNPLDDTKNLTSNGRVYVKPAAEGATSQDNESYQDFEQNVSTSPPEAYDSLHLYGNTMEPQHAYEQVPEKRDKVSYESLHMYSNSNIGQSDYDTPTTRPIYANLTVQSQR